MADIQPTSEELLHPMGSTTVAKKQKLKAVNPQVLTELKFKKAFEIAISPAKSVPMNLIMSYMTGNSLQIIPMSMTLMLLWNPLKAIFYETPVVFKDLTNDDNAARINLCKLAFVLCQFLNMAIGVYKLYKMGLIPHTDADWLAWREGEKLIEKLSTLNIS